VFAKRFPAGAVRSAVPHWPKILVKTSKIGGKKLASEKPNPTIAIKSRNLQVFIMNITIAAKRSLFALLTVTGLALYAVGATQNGPCPLPITSESSSASEDAQSPENPQCRRVVMHNGMPICLPCPAADAHTRVHGDADLGPCDKPGNQK
jgi:hypothetical protein